MKNVDGDLVEMALDGEFDVIVHGCNCKQIMGAGIAGQIAQKIPEAKFVDDMYITASHYDKLSHYTIAPFRNRKGNLGFVVNLYTQYFPGADLRIEALILGFKRVSRILKEKQRIGIPLIGCGIAGGNWDKIGPIIEEIMKDHDLTVVHYKTK